MQIMSFPSFSCFPNKLAARRTGRTAPTANADCAQATGCRSVSSRKAAVRETHPHAELVSAYSAKPENPAAILLSNGEHLPAGTGERINFFHSFSRSRSRYWFHGNLATGHFLSSRHRRKRVTFPNCQQPGGISHASAAMFLETILFIGCSVGIGSVAMNARMVSKLPRTATEQEASRDNRVSGQTLLSARCPTRLQGSPTWKHPPSRAGVCEACAPVSRLPVYQLFDQTRSEQHPVPVKHGIGYSRNPRVQIRESAQGFPGGCRCYQSCLRCSSEAVAGGASRSFSPRTRGTIFFPYQLTRAFDIVGHEEIERVTGSSSLWHLSRRVPPSRLRKTPRSNTRVPGKS